MKRTSPTSTESGIALITALFALLLLSAIAVGMMYMSTTDTSVNANFKDSQTAYWGARAGMEEVRARMHPGTAAVAQGDLVPFLPTKLPSPVNAGSVVYITNPDGGGAIFPQTAANSFYDSELCNAGIENIQPAVFPCATDIAAALGHNGTMESQAPFKAGAAAARWKWVRITLKTNLMTPNGVESPATAANNVTPVCWDGQQQVLIPTANIVAGTGCFGPPKLLRPVYRLTAMGQGTGGAFRFAQMEVADTPPIAANAAVDSQDNVTLNGKLTVNGYDNCNCKCGVTNSGDPQLPCTSRTGMVCDTSHFAIYAKGNIDNPNNSETLMAGTVPPYSEKNTDYPYEVKELIKNYKSAAWDVRNPCGTTTPCGYSCTPVASPPPDDPGRLDCGIHTSQSAGTVPSPFPPTDPSNPGGNPQVTYVPGNLKLTSSSNGNGILIVDGDLDINGGLQFYGLILVKGVIKFTGGGADKTNILGSVLAGQESVVDNILGGSAVIGFDSCALNGNYISSPPRITSFRELTF